MNITRTNDLICAETVPPAPDIVERVARAIRRNKFMRTRRLSALDPTLITEEELEEARAAIEAMREPTEAMLRSAVRTEDRLDEGQVEVNYMVVAFDIWPKMIDAALKVKP